MTLNRCADADADADADAGPDTGARAPPFNSIPSLGLPASSPEDSTLRLNRNATPKALPCTKKARTGGEAVGMA